QEEEETKEQELTLEEIYRLRADGSRPAVPLKPSFSKKTGHADKNITFSKVKKPARGNKKQVVRDPRFDSLAGNVDPEGFRKRSQIPQSNK
ncbi:unnamed protein product, partial [Brassica oleracea]